MPFELLHARCPEIAETETRSVTLFERQDGLPAGSYGFAEMFCDEEGCDCRRAMIQVYADKFAKPMRPLATISFGWEDEAFYRKWASYPLSRRDFDELKGPALASLAPQSRHAPALLRQFEFLVEDEQYVARIARHYAMFRNEIDQRSSQSAPKPIRSGPKTGRNGPCPCGSGKKYKKCCGKTQPNSCSV